MPKNIEALISVASTPSIKKIGGNAVVFSPVAPVLAEIGIVDEEKRGYSTGVTWKTFIYVTNYETQEIIGKMPIANGAHTLAFSPDGEYLLALPGGKGSWNDILIYSEPWEGPPYIHDETLHSVFHGAWIDERTLLIAGTATYNEPCIALLDVEDHECRVLYRQGPQPESTSNESNLDSACCSPSGLVAFSSGYGRRVTIFQLTEDRNRMLNEGSFAAQYNGYGLNVALAKDGQTILCTPTSYERPWVGLFDRQGKLLDTVTLATIENVYQHGIFLAKRLVSRGFCDLQVYRITNGSFRLWSSSSGTCKGDGLDITLKDGDTLIAVEEDDLTKIYKIQDFDILQLSSDEPENRRQAALDIGRRQLRAAVPDLVRLLRDESSEVQMAAIQALEQISDPAALRPLLRALGNRPNDQIRRTLQSTASQFGGKLLFFSQAPDPIHAEILSGLARFPIDELTAVVRDCLTCPELSYRRGAVRVLEEISSIDSLDLLCQVLSDADEGIRLSAARALAGRKDLRACVALLSRLNDESLKVRLEVQQALIAILESNGLLSAGAREQLLEPMDIVSYADQVISKGRMQNFDHLGDSTISRFLNSLASACVNSERPLPEILNSIEALTLETTYTSERVSVSIALTIALLCADAMRKNQKWQGSVGLYRNVVTLSKQAEAPQIEWRAWYAIGEGWELLEDDKQAFEAYRAAVDVIDQVWFALLEEDKLQGFFQDKAVLYDRVGLCALRLGYKALAIEYNEKAKTRYLGDLIARRQMDPPTILDSELKDLWRVIDGARPMRVPLASFEKPGSEPMEIVSVQQETVEPGSVVILPVKFIALEQADKRSQNRDYRLRMVQSLWQLVNGILTNSDTSDVNETLRDHLEDIYQSLLPVWDAVNSASLPLSLAVRDQCIRQYYESAQAIRDEWRIWWFAEYGTGWIEEIANSRDVDGNSVMIDAVMEALNMILRHNPVIGIPAYSAEEEQEGLVFVTRTLGGRPDSASQRTTVINTALEHYSRTRWRYVTRLARGETVNFQKIVKSLIDRPRVAQLQFVITDFGTAVYLMSNMESETRPPSMMPSLKGKDSLQVFTFPKITLPLLNKHLTLGERAWFRRYHARHQPDGLQAWQETMDRILQWLYAELIQPLRRHLNRMGVQHLRIIPHRGLHLIPFSALYRKDQDGRRHYLIEDYSIEYAPSSTIQGICRERAQRASSDEALTAISNPTNDLPFAVAEVEHLMGQFPGKIIHILRGEDARLDKLISHIPGGILHFAGHAHYDWNDPLASYLRFAGEEHLTLADLFAETIRLSQTRLVVLSACETSITSPEDLADEYLGLASGFLFAGAPAVVSSLWNVNDVSTALLMREFYRQFLEEKQDVAYALSRAQAWLRSATAEQLGLAELWRRIYENSGQSDIRAYRFFRYHSSHPADRPFEHPYYWAPFVACGIS